MTHIPVNAQAIRRGLVSLSVPPLDERWEAYRFRVVNREYPARLENLVGSEMERAA